MRVAAQGSVTGSEGNNSEASRKYTAAEDAEILRLKERVVRFRGWENLAAAFDARFATRRHWGTLQVRYSRFLQPDHPSI